jgi:pimeloyl-ACP methyl ester carboxylesterase
MMLSWFIPRPDPAEPIARTWYYARVPEGDRRLFIFLPGRRDRARDFGRHGFITLARAHVPRLDCVAVDATIGYYLDGSAPDRIQREIIVPARALPYNEIWLVGVSMGGMGAFWHHSRYPGEIAGLILLAPFVGDDRKLFTEIDTAGGATAWAKAQPVNNPKRKTDYQRELWRFLGTIPSLPEPQPQIWVAYGDRDRLRPGIERLRTVIPPARLLQLPGAHRWQTWKAGFDQILARIDWPRSELKKLPRQPLDPQI